MLDVLSQCGEDFKRWSLMGDNLITEASPFEGINTDLKRPGWALTRDQTEGARDVGLSASKTVNYIKFFSLQSS